MEAIAGFLGLIAVIGAILVICRIRTEATRIRKLLQAMYGAAGDRSECPFCKQFIKDGAAVCQHCQRNILWKRAEEWKAAKPRRP